MIYYNLIHIYIICKYTHIYPFLILDSCFSSTKAVTDLTGVAIRGELGNALDRGL